MCIDLKFFFVLINLAAFIKTRQLERKLWHKDLFVLQEPASPYPTLVLKNSKYELLIEGYHINGIKDFIHGLSTLISAYWVFDIEFPPSLKKTLIFLCGYVLKLPKVKMMPSVQRIINKLGQ